MPIYKNDKVVQSVYRGSQSAEKVYRGSSLVYGASQYQDVYGEPLDELEARITSMYNLDVKEINNL